MDIVRLYYMPLSGHKKIYAESEIVQKIETNYRCRSTILAILTLSE